MTKKEEFNEMTVKMVRERAAGTKVRLTSVLKLNGVRRTGIAIEKDGSNCEPTCYLDGFYDEDGNLEEMAGMAAESVLRAIDGQDGQGNVDVAFFADYENVKDRICLRVVNAELNREYLSDMPHVPFLDLAACFYYAYEDEAIGKGIIAIKNDHLRRWGIDADRLLEDVKRNERPVYGRVMIPMENMLMEITTGMKCKDEGEDFRLSEMGMYVMTNRERHFGTAGILDREWLLGIRERIGNYYVIPSSVHELIVLRDPGNEGDVSMLRKTVREVNQGAVGPEDYLSDSLYYFDGELKACA